MTTTAHNVLVIACGDTKHATPNGPVRAIDLYAGRQFALARRLQAQGWTVLILSAKHGLIEAGTLVEAYDLRMTASLSRRAVRNVLARSLAAWTFHAHTAGARRVVFYGGELYFRIWEALVAVTGLAKAGRRCDVAEIVGAGCGEHYSVLTAITAAAEPAAEPLALAA